MQVSEGMQGASLVRTPGDMPLKSRDACNSPASSVCREDALGRDSVPEGPGIAGARWQAQVLSGHISKTNRQDLGIIHCCP